MQGTLGPPCTRSQGAPFGFRISVAQFIVTPRCTLRLHIGGVRHRDPLGGHTLPLVEHMPQRFALGPFNDFAALPRYRLDLLLDCLLNERAKVVWVEGVQFPASSPEVAEEPLVTGIVLLF